MAYEGVLVCIGNDCGKVVNLMGVLSGVFNTIGRVELVPDEGRCTIVVLLRGL